MWTSALPSNRKECRNRPSVDHEGWQSLAWKMRYIIASTTRNAMQNVLQDVRYALRQLLKSPGFAVTALLTLAVGIGANVVVFGVINGFLLSPLPVPHPEQVYTVEHRSRSNPLSSSFPAYLDLRDRNNVFSGLAATRVMRIGLEASNVAEPVWGYEVTGNYFETLGIRPVLGRLLAASDEKTDHANEVAVLSYSCWKSRFNAD